MIGIGWDQALPAGAAPSSPRALFNRGGMSCRSLSPLRITSRIRDLFLRSLKELIRRRRLPFNISIVNDGMRKVRHLSQHTLLMKSICCGMGFEGGLCTCR